MKEGFITPPEHIDFEPPKLFGDTGRIIDGAIAYLSPGGGPVKQHTTATTPPLQPHVYCGKR